MILQFDPILMRGGLIPAPHIYTFESDFLSLRLQECDPKGLQEPLFIVEAYILWCKPRKGVDAVMMGEEWDFTEKDAHHIWLVFVGFVTIVVLMVVLTITVVIVKQGSGTKSPWHHHHSRGSYYHER